MGQTYYQTLPLDYMNNLYPRTIGKLQHSENVHIASMNGCGGRTFINFLMFNAKREKKFKRIDYYDLNIHTESDIVNKLSYLATENEHNKLIIIRNLHLSRDPKHFLQKLNSIKQQRSESIVFMITTNHTGILNPNQYIAEANSFFSYRYILKPLNQNETITMIESLENFYGWKISKEDYKEIYNLSGGIPRLVKHICEDMNERQAKINDIDVFLQNASIIFQVNYLTSLILEHSVSEIKNLGIVDEKDRIISRLLETFFNNYKEAHIEQLFPNLSDTELKLLTYMYVNKGKATSKEKLGELMLLGNNNYSLWAIYKQISRLKPKVKSRFNIENIKGKGYVLTPA